MCVLRMIYLLLSVSSSVDALLIHDDQVLMKHGSHGAMKHASPTYISQLDSVGAVSILKAGKSSQIEKISSQKPVHIPKLALNTRTSTNAWQEQTSLSGYTCSSSEAITYDCLITQNLPWDMANGDMPPPCLGHAALRQICKAHCAANTVTSGCMGFNFVPLNQAPMTNQAGTEFWAVGKFQCQYFTRASMTWPTSLFTGVTLESNLRICDLARASSTTYSESYQSLIPGCTGGSQAECTFQGTATWTGDASHVVWWDPIAFIQEEAEVTSGGSMFLQQQNRAPAPKQNQMSNEQLVALVSSLKAQVEQMKAEQVILTQKVDQMGSMAQEPEQLATKY